jgi:hypothetical protein
VKHNPEQRWFWLSSQTPEEALVFVSFDSDSTDIPRGESLDANFKPLKADNQKDALMRLSTWK